MPKRFLAGVFAAALVINGGGYVVNAQQVASTQQQTGICVGTVFDTEGEPVVGATVKVAGANVGTMTDIDGNFSLNGVKKGATINITAIGYASQSKTWNGDKLVFTLSMEDNALDELVVVGYGVQKKANVTGAVSQMNASAIENRSVASVSAAMAGEMPGVVVVQSSGAPGAQTGSITIRGNNSVNSASPLVIVDGVPGSMNNIDPQDVENISVLKDAASAAIYGVQAANGVILITTKKGKLNTAPVISYTGTVSFTSPTTKLDPVNARDYTMLMREAILNVDPTTDVSAYDKKLEQYADGTLDPTGTNWWDETFKSHGTETAHTIQINGGSSNTVYMASLGYLYQGGILSQNTYNRYNARVNLETQLKPWLKFGTNTSFYRGIQKDGYNGVSGIVQHVNRLNASLSPYNEEGELIAPGSMQNPIAEAEKYSTGIYKVKNDQLFTNFYLDIKPIEGLSIKPLFSWRHDGQDYYNFRKVLLYGGSYNGGDNGSRRGNHNYYNWDWMTYQATANYNKTFAEKHSLGLLVGYEALRYMYRYTTAYRENGGDNALDQVLGSLSETGMKNTDGGLDMTRQSWFGRVQYDFDNRYLLEANFRADASSRFPKENRWGYFPAVSAAWRISQESFMEGTRGWLDQLKLRLGWGRTGNEELGDDYYPGVATYAYTNVLMGTQYINGLYESRYVNSNIKWASVTNWELGLEAAMFGSRLTFEGSLYKRTTNDMLLNLPILGVLGVDAPMQNAGSVENKGVDLTIGYNQRFNRDWSIGVTFNAGYNHNEITNLSGTEGVAPGTSDTQWYLEGEAIGSYYGYIADGLFKDEAEVKAGPLRTGNEKPGNIRFKDWASYDEDGNVIPVPDGKVTTADRAVIGKTAPSWMGGINVNVTYRDFDFSMLWQGAFDYERYMTGEASQAFYNGGTINNWMMEERWTPETPNGTYPRLYQNSASSPDVTVINSFWCEDASYVRLKNLTFGYTIPAKITDRIGINRVRVYFNGENLLTFSGIYKKGIDPEAPQGRGAYYANVRKLSLGLKVTF